MAPSAPHAGLRGDGRAPAFAPKHIRLFANRPNLGFDGAMSAPSTQDLELTRADVNGETVIPLRFVKFQSVNSLSVGG